MTTIKDLKIELEKCINDACTSENGEIKLRDDLTIGNMMDLKLVESLINNILVVAQTCAFADEIKEPDIKNKIANPNAKGFDVDCPNSKGERILAELKATVPCNGGGQKYGSNQAKSISKDLENLLGISDKGKNAKITPNDQKYMVLIDVNGQQAAFNNLKKPTGYNASSIRVVYVDSNTPIAMYDQYGW